MSGFPYKKMQEETNYTSLCVYKVHLSGLNGPKRGPLCFYSFHLHFSICGQEF